MTVRRSESIELGEVVTVNKIIDVQGPAAVE